MQRQPGLTSVAICVVEERSPIRFALFAIVPTLEESPKAYTLSVVSALEPVNSS
jgi:hypothetical protein